MDPVKNTSKQGIPLCSSSSCRARSYNIQCWVAPFGFILADVVPYLIQSFLFQAFWYPHLLPKAAGPADPPALDPPPPSYLKNSCSQQYEILKGIRDTFGSLRNFKVVYIVFTWLPQQSLKGEVFGGKSLDTNNSNCYKINNL